MPLPDSPAVEVTYLGGPTVLLSVAGVSFIVDPTFDAAGTSYERGPVSLRKTSGPARAAGDLGRIDVALLSHAQHPDNLDGAGRELLKTLPLVLTTRPSAAELGSGAVGLAAGDRRTIATPGGTTLSVTATPARHGPPGIETLTGEVIGFVISSVETREDLVYISGDTVWYEGTADVARNFHPRLVLLFAGAAMAAPIPFQLTMDTNDAVAAALAFDKASIVPVHHEGWAHFTQTQQDLLEAFSMLGLQHRLQLIEPGRTHRFTAQGHTIVD